MVSFDFYWLFGVTSWGALIGAGALNRANTVNEILWFKSSKPVICWHFNIYEQDKFHAQQS